MLELSDGERRELKREQEGVNIDTSRRPIAPIDPIHHIHHLHHTLAPRHSRLGNQAPFSLPAGVPRYVIVRNSP